MAYLLARPAEVGDLPGGFDDILQNIAGTRRVIVDLVSSALHEHGRGLLLQLRDGLEVSVGLAPRHQVPRHLAVGQIAGVDPGHVYLVSVRRNIAGEVVQLRHHRHRSHRRIQPVTRKLKPGVERVQRVDVMTHIGFELTALEGLPVLPAEVAWALRRIGISGLVLPLGPRGLRVVQARGPAIAIHPDPIQVVSGGHFPQLRNKQFIDIGAGAAGNFRVRSAVFVHLRPLGVVLHRRPIPDARVVNIQPYPMLPRHLAPDRQRISDDARGRPAHLGRVAGVAWVPLAVVLDVVGAYAPEQLRNVLFARLGSQNGVVLGGMQVEVQTEKGILARDRRPLMGLPHLSLSSSGTNLVPSVSVPARTGSERRARESIERRRW